MSDSARIRRTGIVADGRERVLESKRKEGAAIGAAVRRLYGEEMRKSWLPRRLLLEWKIAREIRKEMEKRFPAGTLHTRSAYKS